MNFSVVENLSLERKPFPELEAVYLIQISSLEDVIKDFQPLQSKENQNPESSSSSSSSSQNSVSVAHQPEEYMYKAAHVFVTSGLTQSHIDQARRASHFARHCVTLADINLDFVVEEAFVAHFGNPHYIPDLLNGKIRETTLLQKYRSQVASYFVTFHSVSFSLFHLAHILPCFDELQSCHPLSGRLQHHIQVCLTAET